MDADNPFEMPFDGRWVKWAREREARQLIGRLVKHSAPQNSALIGETYSGKSTLLRWLGQPKQRFLGEEKGDFVAPSDWLGLTPDDSKRFADLDLCYLDAEFLRTLPGDSELRVAAFWSELHKALTNIGSTPTGRGQAHNIKGRDEDVEDTLETYRRDHPQALVLLIDNFDALAYVEIRVSQTLRRFATRDLCRFVVAARYPLYLIRHSHQGWSVPSPFENIFTEPIPLALLTRDEGYARVQKWGTVPQAFETNKAMEFLVDIVGRHPELLRRGASELYKAVAAYGWESVSTRLDELKLRVYQESFPLLAKIWNGLTDPEMFDRPRDLDNDEPVQDSIYQDLFRRVLHRENPRGDNLALAKLEQRGVIFRDRWDQPWQPFSHLMEIFIEQHVMSAVGGRGEAPRADQIVEADQSLAGLKLTPIEKRVYRYLYSHLNSVCSSDAILQAVWSGKPVAKAALQKVIERIRAKARSQPDWRYELQVARGEGYVLMHVPGQLPDN